MNEAQNAEGTASNDAASAIWRSAQAAFKQRDYSAAADELQRLIREFGADAAPIPHGELYFVLGVTLLRLGRTDEGVGQLLKSIEINPHSASAHYKLGLGYGRQKRQSDALEQFQRALHLDPNNAEYLCRLGLQYRRLGRIDEAKAAYELAREIEPDREEAASSLAGLHLAHPLGIAISYPEAAPGYEVSRQAG